MKPNETIFRAKKKYVALMILCFLYGGYSIISLSYNLYSSFWARDILGIPALRELRIEDSNSPFATPQSRPAERMRNANPIDVILSPQALSSFFGGIISILAGLAIWALIREKEIKSIKEQTADNLMLPDEKALINVLKKSGYESTQAKLAKETGLNKVQVHRVIKRLESKGLVQKHVYGLTNKIILKKELFE